MSKTDNLLSGCPCTRYQIIRIPNMATGYWHAKFNWGGGSFLLFGWMGSRRRTPFYDALYV